MKLERIYFFTFLSLIIHQIDAAYWKEWEMFMLPGGVQGFLIFNLVAFPVVILGYRKLLKKEHNYAMYSYICGGLGVLTLILHIVFATFGFKEFHLPLSILIIILCGFFGIWQLLATVHIVDEKKRMTKV